MGAWIETFAFWLADALTVVAPYVGAWIETFYLEYVKYYPSRTLRGCVD